MKINLLLVTIFISVLLYADINFKTGHVGLTKLNGEGCLCHDLNSTPDVNVFIEGPDSLMIGQSALYTVSMNGGPSVKGGFNVAAFSGMLSAVDSSVRVNDNELTHTFAKRFGNATVFWEFEYTAPNTLQWDTLYSVGNSVNGDGNPIPGDKWNFGENFPVKIVENIIPVEFVSFNAVANGNTISLTWTTATETNNYGFEVQRSNNDLFYSTLGFVKGNGTTTENHDYNFKDKFSEQGVYNYRLEQIDFDGSFIYSDVIEVNVNINTFSLEQNYPNPFNPITKIKFTIPILLSPPFAKGGKTGGFITLKVYDVLGNEVATLVSEEKPAGEYEVEFDGTGLTTGIYFYQINFRPSTGSREGQTGQQSVETKKMVLMK